MIRVIHLFFIVFVSLGITAQPKHIPLAFEKMQEIIGEDHVIVYVSSWQYRKSILFDDVLEVRGKFSDFTQFVIHFDGYRDGDIWITNGDAEMCVGESLCDINDFGCNRGCNYWNFMSD